MRLLEGTISLRLIIAGVREVAGHGAPPPPPAEAASGCVLQPASPQPSGAAPNVYKKLFDTILKLMVMIRTENQTVANISLVYLAIIFLQGKYEQRVVRSCAGRAELLIPSLLLSA